VGGEEEHKHGLDCHARHRHSVQWHTVHRLPPARQARIVNSRQFPPPHLCTRKPPPPHIHGDA
jgi:hypothetical protein